MVVRFIAILFCLAILTIHAEAQTARLADAIRLVVHTNVITQSDIDRRILPAVMMLQKQYADNPEEANKRSQQIRNEAIQSLIEEKLIIQEFLDSKLILPQNYVDDELTRRIRSDYGDRITLIKTFKSEGLTYESFQEKIRNEIIIQAMVGKYVESVRIVSPKMIADYYEDHKEDFRVEDQVRLRTLLLIKNEENPQTTQAMGEEILKQLKDGVSFEELCSLYSDDRTLSSQKEAYLEWRDISSLQPQLAEASRNLKLGDISPLIETDTAFWIIKLEDFKATHIKNIEEVRAEIESIIAGELRASLRKNWIDQLRKKYLVRYY